MINHIASTFLIAWW